MSQFQFPVAVVLAASGLFSAGLLLVTRPAEGKVKLPEYIADGTSKDPFDVTKPEDIIEGEPVNEAKFWARVGTTYQFSYDLGTHKQYRCACVRYS